MITHERALVDCAAELNKFVATMGCLGEKLGPMLFQFGYFGRKAQTQGANVQPAQ